MESTCYEHSGCIERIKNLEGDVKILFDKWDSMQKLLIGTLVSAIISCIGIIAMAIKVL